MSSHSEQGDITGHEHARTTFTAPAMDAHASLFFVRRKKHLHERVHLFEGGNVSVADEYVDVTDAVGHRSVEPCGREGRFLGQSHDRAYADMSQEMDIPFPTGAGAGAEREGGDPAEETG
jgi:hypothetical protein